MGGWDSLRLLPAGSYRRSGSARLDAALLEARALCGLRILVDARVWKKTEPRLRRHVCLIQRTCIC